LLAIATTIAACGPGPKRSAEPTYTPAGADELRRVTRSSTGKEDATRAIGTLGAGKTVIDIIASSGGKVILGITHKDSSAATPSAAVISAQPLQPWLAKAEQWLAAPGDETPGVETTEKISVNALDTRENGTGMYSLEISRVLRGSPTSYHIQLDTRNAYAGFDSMPAATVADFLKGLRAASDTAIALAGAKTEVK